jgi:3-isopropylmalate/(R)-2-methylmalate dehydratase small subunit
MSMQPIIGRIWKFGDNINTDLIAPSGGGRTPEERMLKCFSANRPGWSSEVKKGDIIVGRLNFGTGSSRPAAQVFTMLGVAAIMAETVNGLFMRNSINFGVPIFPLTGVHDAFEEPDVAEIDLVQGTVRNQRSGQVLNFPPMPQMFLDILSQGGMLEIMRKRGLIEPLPVASTA